jgi:nicotinate-nucleotide adenylyltransferase
VVCAQEALWQLRLDEVALTPVGDPGHRAIDHDPGREERARLCEAAADGVPWLTVSRVDVERPGQTYTVDTLAELRRADPDAEHVFVLGADQALQLGEWREPARVLELAPLAVAEREGVSFKVVRDVLAPFGDADRISTFSMPRVDVSSTDVRERVAAGRPYRFLVPERVAQRIAEAGLYR